MIAISIIITAAILSLCNIISSTVVCIAIASAIVLEFIAAGLYFKFGFLKILYHDLLGWHTPDDSPQSFDGCSQHATCRHCGKDIMQDSQGNWF